MKKTKILLLSFAALFVLQCTREAPPPILPKITTTGSNNFGCLIDGEVYVAYKLTPNLLQHQIKLDYSYPLGLFNIHTHQISKEGDYIASLSFGSKEVTEEGEYPLTNAVYSKDGIRAVLDTTQENHLTILRFDIKNKIFSGLFEFTVIEDGVPYHITKGRFDIGI